MATTSRAVLLTLALGWPLAAGAYRPFDSTDAAVAARSEVEVELGPLGFEKRGPATALTAPSLVLNWGFADGWELVLQGTHFVQLGGDVTARRFRVEDTAVFLKTILRSGCLQDGHGPSVAIELGPLLPDFHGEQGLGAEATVIVSQRWPDLTVHLNGAAAWTRAHAPGAFAGVILEGHDTWAVRPVAEVFVEGERDVPTSVSGLLGAIWRVSEALSLDAAVRLARAGAEDTTELRVGLTWGFGVGLPR